MDLKDIVSVNSVILFVATGILAWIGLLIRSAIKKNLNTQDIQGWKIKAIDYGVTEVLGDDYTVPRNEKWDDLIEEDKLKNKERW